MYSNKLAVAIKHNGKILRENKDLVALPFGSEFTVLVKNLNSKRAKFTLHIDGIDVLDSQEIIVNGNSEVELKRFIRNGNMNEGNAFKFIERTAAIEDGPRGIKIDDGTVRVEYWFEVDKPEIKVKDIYWDKHYYRDYLSSAVPLGNITTSTLRGTVNQVTAQNAPFSATLSTATAYNASTNISTKLGDSTVDFNDAGITVPGSKVDQKFTPIYGFQSELNSHVIILRMVGMVGAVNVTAPITVKTKNICSTCSHTNKHNAKFCSGCGTSLLLV